MKLSNEEFNREYSRICEQWRSMKKNKAYWPYTSHPDWLWIDGRKTAMEWVMKWNENNA